MTPTSATIGEAAQDYARHLSVAVLKAGACGRVHVQSPDADSGATPRAVAQSATAPPPPGRRDLLRPHHRRHRPHHRPHHRRTRPPQPLPAHLGSPRTGLRRPRLHDRSRLRFTTLTPLFTLLELLDATTNGTVTPRSAVSGGSDQPQDGVQGSWSEPLQPAPSTPPRQPKHATTPPRAGTGRRPDRPSTRRWPSTSPPCTPGAVRGPDSAARNQHGALRDCDALLVLGAARTIYIRTDRTETRLGWRARQLHAARALYWADPRTAPLVRRLLNTHTR